jgi:hypothetical protein
MTEYTKREQGRKKQRERGRKTKREKVQKFTKIAHGSRKNVV